MNELKEHMKITGVDEAMLIALMHAVAESVTELSKNAPDKHTAISSIAEIDIPIKDSKEKVVCQIQVRVTSNKETFTSQEKVVLL